MPVGVAFEPAARFGLELGMFGADVEGGAVGLVGVGMVVVPGFMSKELAPGTARERRERIQRSTTDKAADYVQVSLGDGQTINDTTLS